MNDNIIEGEYMIAENHVEGNHFTYTILSDGTKVLCEVMRQNFKQVGKDKFAEKGINSKLHPDPEAFAMAKLFAASRDLYVAAKALFDAPHQRHFALRLNDEEMAALEKLKKAVKKAETGTGCVELCKQEEWSINLQDENGEYQNERIMAESVEGALTKLKEYNLRTGRYAKYEVESVIRL